MITVGVPNIKAKNFKNHMRKKKRSIKLTL